MKYGFTRLLRALRERGPGDLPRVLVRGAWSNIHSVYVVRWIGDEDRNLRHDADADGVTVRPLRVGDEHAVAHALPFELMRRSRPRVERWIRQTIAQNMRAYLAWRDGELLGGVWVPCYPPAPPEDRLLRAIIDPPIHRIEKVFTVPAARGAGIGRRLLEHAIAELAAANVAALIAQIQEENRPSLAAHQRAGFELLGVLRTRWRLGVPRHQITRTSHTCAELGLAPTESNGRGIDPP